ncbi:MAG: SSU ribosomal protein S5p (S2e), partial [uncultured Phycisphaerae bacterium]
GPWRSTAWRRRPPRPAQQQRRARQRVRREAGAHQPRRRHRQRWSSLLVRRADGGRRPEGPRGLRPRQGPRGAGSHPQGDRGSQEVADPRAAAREPHPAPRRLRPSRRGQGDAARGASGHRRDRRRPDARGARDAGRAGRRGQEPRLVQPVQHDPRHHGRAEAAVLAPAGRQQARQEGRRHPGPAQRRRVRPRRDRGV